jgi:hypothetical protein
MVPFFDYRATRLVVLALCKSPAGDRRYHSETRASPDDIRGRVR